MGLILRFDCCRITVDTMHPQPSGWRYSINPQRSNGRGERPGWAILYVSAKSQEWKGSIYHTAYMGKPALCTWYH